MIKQQVENHLLEFAQLNAVLIKRRVPAEKYVQKFEKLWYKDWECQNKNDFDILEDLFWSIEAFEPDGNIRKHCSHCIGAEELFQDVKKHQQMLLKLLMKNEKTKLAKMET